MADNIEQVKGNVDQLNDSMKKAAETSGNLKDTLLSIATTAGAFHPLTSNLSEITAKLQEMGSAEGESKSKVDQLVDAVHKANQSLLEQRAASIALGHGIETLSTKFGAASETMKYFGTHAEFLKKGGFATTVEEINVAMSKFAGSSKGVQAFANTLGTMSKVVGSWQVKVGLAAYYAYQELYVKPLKLADEFIKKQKEVANAIASTTQGSKLGSSGASATAYSQIKNLGYSGIENADKHIKTAAGFNLGPNQIPQVVAIADAIAKQLGTSLEHQLPVIASEISKTIRFMKPEAADKYLTEYKLTATGGNKATRNASQAYDDYMEDRGKSLRRKSEQRWSGVSRWAKKIAGPEYQYEENPWKEKVRDTLGMNDPRSYWQRFKDKNTVTKFWGNTAEEFLDNRTRAAEAGEYARNKARGRELYSNIQGLQFGQDIKQQEKEGKLTVEQQGATSKAVTFALQMANAVGLNVPGLAANKALGYKLDKKDSDFAIRQNESELGLVSAHQSQIRIGRMDREIAANDKLIESLKDTSGALGLLKNAASAEAELKEASSKARDYAYKGLDTSLSDEENADYKLQNDKREAARDVIGTKQRLANRADTSDPMNPYSQALSAMASGKSDQIQVSLDASIKQAEADKIRLLKKRASEEETLKQNMRLSADKTLPGQKLKGPKGTIEDIGDNVYLGKQEYDKAMTELATVTETREKAETALKNQDYSKHSSKELKKIIADAQKQEGRVGKSLYGTAETREALKKAQKEYEANPTPANEQKVKALEAKRKSEADVAVQYQDAMKKSESAVQAFKGSPEMQERIAKTNATSLSAGVAAGFGEGSLTTQQFNQLTAAYNAGDTTKLKEDVTRQGKLKADQEQMQKENEAKWQQQIAQTMMQLKPQVNANTLQEQMNKIQGAVLQKALDPSDAQAMIDQLNTKGAAENKGLLESQMRELQVKMQTKQLEAMKRSIELGLATQSINDKMDARMTQYNTEDMVHSGAMSEEQAANINSKVSRPGYSNDPKSQAEVKAAIDIATKVGEQLSRGIASAIAKANSEFDKKEMGLNVARGQREGYLSGKDTSTIDQLMKGGKDAQNYAKQFAQAKEENYKQEMEIIRKYNAIRMRIIEENYDNTIKMERAKLEANDRRDAPKLDYISQYAAIEREKAGIKKEFDAARDARRQLQDPETARQQHMSDKRDIEAYNNAAAMVKKQGLSREELNKSSAGRKYLMEQDRSVVGAAVRKGQGKELEKNMMDTANKQQEAEAAKMQLQMKERELNKKKIDEQLQSIAVMESEAKAKGTGMSEGMVADKAQLLKRKVEYQQETGDIEGAKKTQSEYEKVFAQLNAKQQEALGDSQKAIALNTERIGNIANDILAVISGNQKTRAEAENAVNTASSDTSNTAENAKTETESAMKDAASTFKQAADAISQGVTITVRTDGTGQGQLGGTAPYGNNK